MFGETLTEMKKEARSFLGTPTVPNHLFLRVWLAIQILAVPLMQDDLSNSNLFVFFGSANFLLLIRAALLELMVSEGLQARILAIYLLGASMKLGIGLAYIGYCIQTGYESFVLSYGPDSAIGYGRYGYLLFLITDLVVISVFVQFRRKSVKATQTAEPNQQALLKGVLYLVLASLFIAVFSKIGPPSLKSSIIESLGAYCFIPGACIICLRLYSLSRSSNYLFYAIGVTGLYFLVNFTILSKAALIAPMIPWIIHFMQVPDLRGKGWNRLRAKKIASVAIILVVIAFVCFPLVQLGRKEVGFGEANAVERDADIMSLLAKTFASAIPGSSEFWELHSFPSGGAWSVASRNSNIVAAAWAFKYVELNDHFSGQFIIDSAIAMVPRVVWPDKPPYQPGRKLSIMTGHDERINSFIDAGDLAGGLYLNGGFLAVFIGAGLNGLFMAILCNSISSSSNYSISSACSVAYMQVVGVQHFEGGIDGNLQFWFIILAILIAGKVLERRVRMRQAGTFA